MASQAFSTPSRPSSIKLAPSSSLRRPSAWQTRTPMTPATPAPQTPAKTAADARTTTADLLFIRPTPGSKPASLDYSTYVKAVLRSRSTRMYVLEALAVYITLSITVVGPQPGALWNLFSLTTIFLGFLAFAFGTLPILVLRKQILSVRPPVYKSRSEQLRHLLLANPRTSQIILTHVVASVMMTIAYAGLTSQLSEGASLGPRILFPGRDVWQVNERFIFIFLWNLSWAVWYSIAQTWINRHVVQFPVEARTLAERVQSRLPTKLLQSLSLMAAHNVTFTFTYLLLRHPLLRFFVTRMGGKLFRRYLVMMFRHNAVSLPLVARGLLSSIFITLSWEFANVLFDVYSTQPIAVSQYANEPNKCLLDGMRSADPHVQHFAFAELVIIARFSPERRELIFKDLKIAPNAFQNFAHECLKVIGKSYRTLNPKKSPSKPPATDAAVESKSQIPPAAQASSVEPPHARSAVRHDNVLLPRKKSLFDNLVNASERRLSLPTSFSTSSVPSAPKPAPVAAKSVSNLASRTPSVFRQTVPEQAQGIEGASPQAVQVSAAERKWENGVPVVMRKTKIYEWLFEPNVAAAIEEKIGDRQLIIWSTEAVSCLLAASLTEDPYGVAQSEIPKALEALTLYIGALENFIAELNSTYLPPDPSQGEQDELAEAKRREKADALQVEIREKVLPVLTATKESIHLILDTFAEYIGEFRFPPRIAQKLQSYLDWR